MTALAAARPFAALRVRALPTWLAVLGLFAVALAVRAIAAAQVPYAPNEGSAYYAGVARNLVEGRGLVTDAMWSYATPPLVLPRPAFELWLPMASFVSALPMALFGTGYANAQLGAVALGATVAPLTFLVARDAARRNGLDARRVTGVALGAGLLAAVVGPFLTAAAAPDSTTPFLVTGMLACLLMPRALGLAPPGGVPPPARARLVAAAALGIMLGLAYLSRQEAVHLGLAYLVLAFGVGRSARRTGTAATGRIVTSVLATVAGGLLVVVPWLARNLASFGTLFPGQALENVYLTTNEGIFAYLDRPTLDSFLAQGVPGIVANQVRGLVHDLGEVLLLQAFPVGLIGLVGVVALRRTPAIREPTALRALVISGVVTYLVTSLLLPVATLWGTFLHAAGPLVAALTVTAMLALDDAVARVSRIRGWAQANRILAPIGLLALAVPFAALQVSLLGGQARRTETRLAAVGAALAAVPEVASAPGLGDPPRPAAAFVSDHPIWLAEALRRPVVALPDEPPRAVARLASDFGTTLVVVLDERGRYPAAFRSAEGAACFTARDLALAGGSPPAGLFIVRPECTSP